MSAASLTTISVVANCGPSLTALTLPTTVTTTISSSSSTTITTSTFVANAPLFQLVYQSKDQTASQPTSSPITASPTASPTSRVSPTPVPSGLSTGAKAGIGVGVVLGVILVAVFAFFLMKMRRRTHTPVSQDPHIGELAAWQRHEADGNMLRPHYHEAEGSIPYRMGHDRTTAIELQGSDK